MKLQLQYIAIKVLILDDNSEIGAHVQNESCNLIWLLQFSLDRIGKFKNTWKKYQFSSTRSQSALRYHII